MAPLYLIYTVERNIKWFSGSILEVNENLSCACLRVLTMKGGVVIIFLLDVTC